MAFQLELNRMKTYNLEALPTSNRKMYLYLGKAKVSWFIRVWGTKKAYVTDAFGRDFVVSDVT